MHIDTTPARAETAVDRFHKIISAPQAILIILRHATRAGAVLGINAG